MPKLALRRMAPGALMSLSFCLEVPAGGVMRESKNLNLFRDIRPRVPFAARAFPYPERRHWIYKTVIIAAIFAYGGVAALGMPAFRLLRASKHAAFWIAPILDFAVGVVCRLAIAGPSSRMTW
jgi:hypothetical protein